MLLHYMPSISVWKRRRQKSRGKSPPTSKVCMASTHALAHLFHREQYGKKSPRLFFLFAHKGGVREGARMGLAGPTKIKSICYAHTTLMC